MNFFKRFQKQPAVSVLDKTNDSESVKLRQSSGGLKRSMNVSFSNGHSVNKTSSFEEPFCTSGNNSPPSDIASHSGSKASKTNSSKSHETGTPVIKSPVHFSIPVQSSNNHDSVSSTTGNSNVEETRLPSMLPAEDKSQEMMALYASIIRGEKSEVKKFLTEHPNLLEAADNFGRTPLMYCVLSDRLDCAKLLLKMKCKLDQVDNAGRSAIHVAAHKASYKFLVLLYERGGSIEVKDNDGQTPLHLTTRNRHPRCLDFLLRRLSPGMAEVTDNQNRTALHWSAAFNNCECVKLLIKYNCNTAISDAEGKTPLHWAASTHDPSAVATMKALLDSSPSALNWQNYEGRTALHFAVAHENVAAVQYLLQFEQEKCEVDRLDNTFRTPLHWAAQLGNTDIVKLLLSVGAKNSISDGHGATPLLYAALHNNPAVIMEMIEHDPNILDQSDIEGRTALMWAAGKGANDVIHMLFKLGNNTEHGNASTQDNGTLNKEAKKLSEPVMVDINRTDNKGNTALHMASWSGCARSAELLLNHNARHDLQNNMNHTPLFGACEKGHLPVVKHLIDNNASITLRDLEDRTPLHWAALGGHAEVCDFLIKKGLHPDVRDAFQRSPLHCAAFGGFINCMNLLLENKANVDLQDQEGVSALHWAAQSGHLDATKLLIQCSAFSNLMEFTEERLTPLDHALLNGRDEVAQYLIEQGALSSETIRDIAAARIQACYRGHQVRKAFLHRKNLLMKHEMLRNKNNRNRTKKKQLASSSDHLNFVGEEPVPKSPNVDSMLADSLCSGEESRADMLDEATADVTTVQSTGAIISNEVNPKPPDSEESSGEDNHESAKTKEKDEDTSHVAVSRSSVVFTASVDMQQTCKKEQLEEANAVADKEVAVTCSGTSEPAQDGSGTTDQAEAGEIENAVMQNPKAVSSAPSFSRESSASSSLLHNSDERGKDCDETTEVTVTTGNATPTKGSTPFPSDTSCKSSNERLKEKRKRKRKHLQKCKVNEHPTSASSDKTTVDVENKGRVVPRPQMKRQNGRQLRRGSTSNNCERVSTEPCSTEDNRTSSSSLTSSESSTSFVKAVPGEIVINAELQSKKANLEELIPDTCVTDKADEDSMEKNQANTLNCNSSPSKINLNGSFDESRVTSHTSNQVTLKEKSSVEKAEEFSDEDMQTNYDYKPKETTVACSPSFSTSLVKDIPDENSVQSHPGNADILVQTSINRDMNESSTGSTINSDESALQKTHYRRTVDNFLDIGDEDNISLEQVRGLAYSQSEAFRGISLHHSPNKELSNTFHLNSNLSLAEYIESLMSMSESERQILATLQENRKHAFKQANAAVKIIQKAWRRFLKRKYPNRVFEKPRKQDVIRKEKSIIPVKSNSPPDSRAPSAKSKTSHSDRKSAKRERQLASRESKRTSSISRRVDKRNTNAKKEEPHSIPITENDQKNSENSSVTESASSDVLRSSMVSGETPHNTTKKKIVDTRKKQRPRTSHAAHDLEKSAEFHTDSCGLRNSLVTDFASEHGSTYVKSRPRTVHGNHRPHNLVLTREDILNKRVQQLFKVYGQTLVLQDMYTPEKKGSSKNRFKTVTAPSVRTKTSRTQMSADIDGLHFNDPRYYDPVTAVQSHPPPEWKSSSAKRRTSAHALLHDTEPAVSPLRRRKSLKRYKAFESDLSFLPVQWQQIYNDMKKSSVLNQSRTSSTSPTRFSYNMR